MLLNIDDIQEKVNGLALRAGLSNENGNVCTASTGDGKPYITFENNEYNYIHSERGYEFSRKTTRSIDELLYWIMSSRAYRDAFQYELENRVKGRDGRRIVFPKFIELMSAMNPSWESEARDEITNILTDAPYNDSLYT